jgi:phage tail sheath protein FI
MPEYLAPAVYVEETSFRSKSIEGVSTSTTGFIGPTRKGPILGTPELITSFGDFERIYGGFNNLEFSSDEAVNYIANAVKNYFDNGGSRLFIARVDSGGNSATSIVVNPVDPVDPDNPVDPNNIRFIARTPGAVGNGTITITVISVAATLQAIQRAPNGTILQGNATLHRKSGDIWIQNDTGSTELSAVAVNGLNLEFVSINVLTVDSVGNDSFYENLGLVAEHPRFIGAVLSSTPSRRIEQLENTFAIDIGSSVDGFRLFEILNGFTAPIPLTGGSDGDEPVSESYTSALETFAANEDISIVAAPGYSSFSDTTRTGIQDALITHAESRRAYRIAVLDTPQAQTVTGAVSIKSRIDSSYAALYHPWIFAANPLSQPANESIPREILLPPSGFVCGIYARNDNDKGVSKSPGNEIVRGALRYETDISFAEQEILNPRGVNCLRFFPGRGNRLWGARTTSSDPEWKYVGPRRYFLYLEHSIDRSTQWVVFENNGPQLWTNVRETVSSFLYNEWVSGALLGANPDEAYFVRCDRSTMTQNDLDNGRLICLIGVAALKLAEFVVFRIGQKTAEARS